MALEKEPENIGKCFTQLGRGGGIHLVTQEGNKHIWNKLQGKKKKKRPIPPSPAKEKEAWALRSLGVKEWHEAACTTRR